MPEILPKLILTSRGMVVLTLNTTLTIIAAVAAATRMPNMNVSAKKSFYTFKMIYGRRANSSAYYIKSY